MCMCILTTNKFRELGQKSIFQQETCMKYSTGGNSTFLCVTTLLSEEAEISSKGKRIERGFTAALMALYWQLFPGEP